MRRGAPVLAALLVAGALFDSAPVASGIRYAKREVTIPMRDGVKLFTARNPQTFVDIAHAKPEDFRVATQRIYRGRGQGLRLTVLPN